MFVGVCVSNINDIRHYPWLPASDMTSTLLHGSGSGETVGGLTPAPVPGTFITNH